MLGALTGNTIGSVYEVPNAREHILQMLQDDGFSTDDRIIQAVKLWLLTDKEHTLYKFEEAMKKYAYDCPRPALNTDCVIFGYDIQGELSVLLIECAGEPHEECWAFLGGLLEMNETTEESASRNLQEETGLIIPAGRGQLMEVGCYYADHRNPRGYIITIPYFATIEKCEVKDSNNSRQVRWFSLFNLPPLAFNNKRILDDAILRKHITDGVAELRKMSILDL